MTTPTPHKHAALIKAWADDPSQDVWEYDGQWDLVTDPVPVWYDHLHYALGPKPTQPPRKMCSLAGVEFPEPLKAAPRAGSDYFVPNILGGLLGDTWVATVVDLARLGNGEQASDRRCAMSLVENYSRKLILSHDVWRP
jgi:hypothetical protein